VADVLRQFSYTVAFSTLMSLLVSFTVTPWLTANLANLEHLNPANPLQWVLIQFEKGLSWLTAWYGRALDWTLSHKLVFTGGLVALFAGIGWMMSLGIMGQEMFAEGDQGKFRLRMEAAKSTPLRQNNLMSLETEQYLLQKPEVESVFANVGGPRTGVGSTGLGAEYQSELTVQLRQQPMPTVRYMINLQNELSARFPGIEFSASNVGIVNQAQAPIEIILTSPDEKELLAAGQKLKQTIRAIPGANDVRVSVEDNGNPEIRIALDREKMAQLGLNTGIVGGTLRNAFAGNHDARFRENNTDYDIRVQLDAFDRRNPEDLRRLSFVNNQGRLIHLDQFASVTRSAGPSQLERKDRQNAVTVTAYTIGRPAGTLALDIDKALAVSPLPTSVKMIWGGDIKRQNESFGSMGLAMLAALILIYLILVALYDNFIYPLVVLFSIPVSLIGALLALNLSMTNMSIFTMLGLLMLLGLVAKNAILIVDFTNQLKAQGKHYREAIVEAGRERLRPILMTTIAMVVGMIPIAIAKGADAEWKNGLAWVLIGGLLSSMVLTVFVAPLLYYLIDRIRELASGLWKRRQGHREVVQALN
jgi:HAE1 family hydrophobic/amphiphilic exporter-1